MSRKSMKEEAGRMRLISVAADWLSTALAWGLFNVVRFFLLKVGYVTFTAFVLSPKVLASQLLFPTAMLAVYWLTGYYNEPLRRSRLNELWLTAVAAFIGSLAVLVLMLLNDLTERLDIDWLLLGALFALLLVIVYLPRALITSRILRRFRRGELSYRAGIIGALDENCRGMLRRNHMTAALTVGHPSELTDIDSLDCIVIARPEIGIDELAALAGELMATDLPILFAPRSEHLAQRRYGLGGSTARANRVDTLGSDIIVDLSRTQMPSSTLNIKRLSDIFLSSIALAVTGPLILVMATAVKLTSPGPAFYRQTRLGRHRHPFDIIKLRTMRVDAEALTGPTLASADDPRVTPVGRFLRKYRIDELPQFVNVLRGDMSLVGPRPERPHFVARIEAIEPAYSLLYQLRPGITSWGMVSYGYASSVEEMTRRLPFDLLYLENVGFVIDIKIMLHTIRTIVTGKGL